MGFKTKALHETNGLRHRSQICVFSGLVIGWWSKLRVLYIRTQLKVEYPRGCSQICGQIWSGYGCKARPPTGWGIQWEHRLKKWGVIGWEHDFWHSVREKYKNMWGHRVRAKSSQKSRVFGWYLKQSIVRVLPGILSDAGVVGILVPWVVQ